jgi:hypothetical protein
MQSCLGKGFPEAFSLEMRFVLMDGKTISAEFGVDSFRAAN